MAADGDGGDGRYAINKCKMNPLAMASVVGDVPRSVMMIGSLNMVYSAGNLLPGN